MVGQIATVAFMLGVAATVNAVFVEGRAVDEVRWLFVGMTAALATRAVATSALEVAADRASGRVRMQTRDRLVRHLFDVGPGGLVRQRVGDVTSTVGAGVEALHDYVTRFVPATVLGVTGPLIVFVTVAVLDPWSTLILLFTGPMLVLLLAVIGSRTRALTQRRFDELGWLSAFYLDMIRGLPTLKAFGRSRDGGDTVEDVSRRFGDTTMEVLRTAFQTSLVMEWAATAATALVAVAVSFRMIESNLSFATGFAVLVLVPEFFVPFRRLALDYHAGQAGRAALERIAELTATSADDRAPSVTLPGDSVNEIVPVIAPTIEFVDVSFTYPGSDRPALEGFTLRLEAGSTVALVGPSGAGKTTATRLLMRFVEPSVGHIEVNGHPIGELDGAAWRRRVAWVPQDPAVFAGTIADNIRLGWPEAPDEAVRAAADVGRASGFIDELPDGFATVLGEHGLRLSGGQRQRLAIARAALRDAPVVVLDEFTAHLDDDTETEVLDAIGDLLVGRTALVVAHRPLTIARADRVVTLAAGRAAGALSESGTGPVRP